MVALWSLVVRGLALFLGAFIAIGLVGELRGRTLDPSLWWIDLGDLSPVIRIALLGSFAVVAIAWPVSPSPGPRRRSAMTVEAAAFTLLALRDTVQFVSAVAGGLVHPTFPIPLSVFVAAGLASIAMAAPAMRAPGDGRALTRLIGLGGAALGWAIVFPLAQMFFFGATDYRRPADAAVVFGARVYATGRPSPLLSDRIRSGVELYRAGLVPTLVMSGGDGADGFNEANVMHDEAIDAGVTPGAIVVDPAGVTTEATVANTVALLSERAGGHAPTRIIAVSQAYHLPRIQLSFATAGIDVLTVPAAESQPISEMPLLVAREVPAWWVYYLRVCLG